MNKFRYDPAKHHRRSIRLKGFDYASEGAYFVTIVTQGRECLFGEIINGEMILNEAGQMVLKWWNELPNKFPDVILGAFIIMPNHFHGIIIIKKTAGADLRVCPDTDLRVCPDTEKHISMAPGEHAGSPRQRPNAPLSQIIQWFKTMTTNEYIRGVKQLGWAPFNGKLWQRNYYEHIIRNERALQQITDYISNNPSSWDKDRENGK